MFRLLVMDYIFRSFIGILQHLVTRINVEIMVTLELKGHRFLLS